MEPGAGRLYQLFYLTAQGLDLSWFLVAALSFLYGTWMIIDKLIWGNAVAGYPSLLVSILFLGGVQLIGIGVLGEYIGRIYIETKKGLAIL
jgi:hypothetical protein